METSSYAHRYSHRTLVTLFGSERADEKESSELLLLADVRDIFNTERVTAMSSELLAARLGMNGNGWGSWYGRGITGRDIAALVKPYGIHSVNVRTEDGVRMGYKWDDFHPSSTATCRRWAARTKGM
jgi:hypothetical protein